MKHKTSELTGDLLDAAVAMAEGRLVLEDEPRWPKGDYLALRKEFGGQHVVRWYSGSGELGGWEPLSNQGSPSTNWDDGGPIIERERITVMHCPAGFTAGDEWEAYIGYVDPRRLDLDPADGEGLTPLIAAMRAYVTRKLGGEVDL